MNRKLYRVFTFVLLSKERESHQAQLVQLFSSLQIKLGNGLLMMKEKMKFQGSTQSYLLLPCRVKVFISFTLSLFKLMILCFYVICDNEVTIKEKLPFFREEFNFHQNLIHF